MAKAKRGRPRHPDIPALVSTIDQVAVVTGSVPKLNVLYDWLHSDRSLWDGLTSEQRAALIARPVLFNRPKMARGLVARVLRERRDAFQSNPQLRHRITESSLGWNRLSEWLRPEAYTKPEDTFRLNLDTICRQVFKRGLPPKAAKWAGEPEYRTRLEQIDPLAALLLLINFDFCEMAHRVFEDLAYDDEDPAVLPKHYDRWFEPQRTHDFIAFAPWLAPTQVDLEALFESKALGRLEILGFMVRPLAEARWSQLRWWLMGELTTTTDSTWAFYPQVDGAISLDGRTEQWSWARAIKEISKYR
jgi:hypothetical protein